MYLERPKRLKKDGVREVEIDIESLKLLSLNIEEVAYF